VATKVPSADLRLLDTGELRVDESALTGGYRPAAKSVPAVAADAGPADRTTMAYAGVLVSSGTGRVVAIGSDTESGRVHHLVAATRSVDTPLTRKLARFSGVLTVVIFGLAALGVGVGMLRGQPFRLAGHIWTCAGVVLHFATRPRLRSRLWRAARSSRATRLRWRRCTATTATRRSPSRLDAALG
jgi:magnesium-transporting ATPase (P-type)